MLGSPTMRLSYLRSAATFRKYGMNDADIAKFIAMANA